jgi:tryptophanyl-tRNA synthetase
VVAGCVFCAACHPAYRSAHICYVLITIKTLTVASLPDDEKFLFKHELTVQQTRAFSIQNAKDIIAVGFDLDKTFVFSDYDYVGGAFYHNVSKISRQITYSQAKATFGFNDS